VVIFSAVLTAGSDNGDPEPLSTVPDYLDILYATIEEAAPDYSLTGADDVPGREVILRMELDGEPSCPSGSTFLGYCFLIDSDMDGMTGTTDPAFGTLGIDARICLECNETTGNFESTLGTATVETDSETGITTIEIYTTIDQLPSIEFDWISACQEDSVFVRLPALPDYGTWTTIERSMY